MLALDPIDAFGTPIAVAGLMSVFDLRPDDAALGMRVALQFWIVKASVWTVLTVSLARPTARTLQRLDREEVVSDADIVRAARQVHLAPRHYSIITTSVWLVNIFGYAWWATIAGPRPPRCCRVSSSSSSRWPSGRRA